MTNLQLDLSLGIPALLTLMSTTIMLFLFNGVNGRMDRLETKIDRLDNKVDGTRLELTSRIDRVADATSTFYRELDKHTEAIRELKGRTLAGST